MWCWSGCVIAVEMVVVVSGCDGGYGCSAGMVVWLWWMWLWWGGRVVVVVVGW